MTRAGVIALALLLAGPAFGQACLPRASILEQLADKYGESRRAVGMAANGMVMEIFAAPAGGWSITATSPEGVTCLVASGTAFEALADPLPPQGEPG